MKGMTESKNKGRKRRTIFCFTLEVSSLCLFYQEDYKPVTIIHHVNIKIHDEFLHESMHWVNICLRRVSQVFSFLHRVMWPLAVRKKRELKTSLPNRILPANRLVCVCMCVWVCACVLLSDSLWHVTVTSTGPSEGGNERFAAQVITKGMEPLLAEGSWCRWLTQCSTTQWWNWFWFKQVHNIAFPCYLLSIFNCFQVPFGLETMYQCNICFSDYFVLFRCAKRFPLFLWRPAASRIQITTQMKSLQKKNNLQRRTNNKRVQKPNRLAATSSTSLTPSRRLCFSICLRKNWRKTMDQSGNVGLPCLTTEFQLPSAL